MIGIALAAPLGLMLGGLPGALVAVVAAVAWPKRSPRRDPPSTRLVMILLLVELGSGSSVLAALQRTSDRLPHHDELRTASRLATVVGLTPAIAGVNRDLRPLMAQLARAQHSGAPVAAAVRRLLDQDLAADRTRRIARARTLPLRLMIPVTLLMLPGLVLFLYAPALLHTFDQMTGIWS